MNSANSFTVRIWIAGDLADAKRAVREFCAVHGDCYAVTPCDFIFSGGQESGVCVSRINYAKYPLSPEELDARVRKLAEFLAVRLCQRSYSIETPILTTWFAPGVIADQAGHAQ